MLAHEIRPGAGSGHGAGKVTLVLLHGRGSHRRDLLGLAPLLPAEWTLVTPEAPFPGAPWGYGPGWAWYRYAGEDRVEEDTLADTLERLDSFMEALPGIVGGDPGTVVLGGFSQGGTTSLAWGLTRPGRVHGILNLSGFLVDAPQVMAGLPAAGDPAAGPSATPPVFWGHGRLDPAIPWTLAERGRARLQRLGVSLTLVDHEGGHWIEPAQVEAVAAFVSAVARQRGAAPGRPESP